MFGWRAMNSRTMRPSSVGEPVSTTTISMRGAMVCATRSDSSPCMKRSAP